MHLKTVPPTAVFRCMAGKFSQKTGAQLIVEPTPWKRACSERLYGPACQKGFTSPLSLDLVRLQVYDSPAPELHCRLSQIVCRVS